MPTEITDSSEFTEPINGPADADPQNAAAYNPGFQGLANRTRWLANLLGGADGTAEWAYPAPRARTWSICGIDRIVVATDASGARLWSMPNSVVFPALLPLVDDATAWLYLDLPSGAVLSQVELAIACNSGSRSGGQRWQAAVYRQDWAQTLDPPIGAMVDDGGGTGSTSIVMPITAGNGAGGTTHVVGVDERIQIRIKGPTSPHASLDYIKQARATWTDPGPRNF